MTKSLVIDGRTMNATEIAQLNVDWFGWADAPGGEQFEAGFGAQYDAWMDAMDRSFSIVDDLGEDVDFAQAQMVAECAEASWHRFSCS